MKLTIEQIAKVAHEVNKSYCDSIGDHSQTSWSEAPQWQKDSSIKGVEYILNYPYSTPADVHASWLEEKRRDGWKYGPVKDPITKEHPCFVPYEELPIEQQTKDHLYRTIVKQLLEIEIGD